MDVIKSAFGELPGTEGKSRSKGSSLEVKIKVANHLKLSSNGWFWHPIFW
jgi:hypothetical protein